MVPLEITDERGPVTVRPDDDESASGDEPSTPRAESAPAGMEGER